MFLGTAVRAMVVVRVVYVSVSGQELSFFMGQLSPQCPVYNVLEHVHPECSFKSFLSSVVSPRRYLRSVEEFPVFRLVDGVDLELGWGSVSQERRSFFSP